MFVWFSNAKVQWEKKVHLPAEPIYVLNYEVNVWFTGLQNFATILVKGYCNCFCSLLHLPPQSTLIVYKLVEIFSIKCIHGSRLHLASR